MLLEFIVLVICDLFHHLFNFMQRTINNQFNTLYFLLRFFFYPLFIQLPETLKHPRVVHSGNHKLSIEEKKFCVKKMSILHPQFWVWTILKLLKLLSSNNSAKEKPRHVGCNLIVGRKSERPAKNAVLEPNELQNSISTNWHTYWTCTNNQAHFTITFP